MKKIFTFIVCLIMTTIITGCINTTDNGHLTTTSNFASKLELVDIEFNGEVHQYVFYEGVYEGSLSHWEGCKYCKHNDE